MAQKRNAGRTVSVNATKRAPVVEMTINGTCSISRDPVTGQLWVKPGTMMAYPVKPKEARAIYGLMLRCENYFNVVSMASTEALAELVEG
jgi:hypothetical protein